MLLIKREVDNQIGSVNNVDPLLERMLAELNDNGYLTKYSCQGNATNFSYIIFTSQEDALQVYDFFKIVLQKLRWSKRYWVTCHDYLHPHSTKSSTKTKRVVKWDKSLTYNSTNWSKFEKTFLRILTKK